MLRRLLLLTVIGLVSVGTVRAQYDVPFSHYWDMEPYFNPASVGKDAKMNVVGAYAMDMAGFKHNPQTMYLGADMPVQFLNRYHGVGVSLLNDKLGLFSHERISAQYSFQIKMMGGVLGIGVLAGLLSENFDGSRLDLEDSSDPAFATSELTGHALDVGVGLYYRHGPWYAGASVQHVNAPLVELGETNELQIDRTYYLTGGCNIRLRNPLLSIHTSALVRTDGVGYRGDVTGRLVYTSEKKKMYGGLTYSPTNSVTFLIGGNLHGFNVGYSYELYTSAINPGNGSHELFVGYQTDLNMVKKGKNRHQSVRLL